MTKNKPNLTVVPFVQKPVDPGRAGRISEIIELVSRPDMLAAICIVMDKDGQPLMVSTNDDPMLVSYMYRLGDNIVNDYVTGNAGLDDVALDDEE